MQKLSLLVALILTGCATKSHLLNQADLLPYQDSSQLTKVNLEDSLLEISEIVDERDDLIIGHAYTGVEYLKTPVYFKKEMSQFMMDYLISSFEARNLEVVKESSKKLRVLIKKFKVYEVLEKFHLEKAKCEVEIGFELAVGGNVWSGNYRTDYLSGGNLDDGSDKLAPTVASCMNDLMESLVNDEKFIKTLAAKE